ncbi:MULTISPECIES: DUF2474 domain-containing protein [Pseudomonas]|uniref:DUF2474 domain-containing protein n=1 Tax=Pseudomonas protegens (strain DSM 19095 / LMG 27888 / CFBP 6595 / CHA0) TaxID=1124983 RepID=A0A2C9EPF1_PSEPH|nr:MULTISPECIES: DUF2474 domain-containing protein [Pseudomonas]BCQ63076.1 hypothetical protein PBOI14_48260 [Pseudomonas sp. Boi14]GED77746.1 hypothetical protein PFL02_45960 [Pseudomonas fluorescens]AGL85546.1 hypothetical protein PFLCHA0_c37790 [Pseudomonas protegens CHA0]AQT10708.1 hypothetical protein H78_04049 [Pseudomonas protegens]MBF0642991.1 DUF2474 domain-containing protein [Pseudomonas protegens]
MDRLSTRPPRPASTWQRLLWMGGIWLASVVGLGLVAGVLRLLMQAAGMHSH